MLKDSKSISFMIEDAQRHTLGRIASTPINHHPFPHVVIDDVFPADFYAELQRRMLPDALYTPLTETGRVKGPYSPARLTLFPEQLDAATAGADNAQFWQGLFAAYSSPALSTAWFELFKEQISARIRSREVPDYVTVEDFAAEGETFLVRDKVNYSLLPHTDNPRKIISVLFYLPPTDTDAALGTSLYAPRTPGLKHLGAAALPREAFDLVTTLPFRANTVVAFPKTSVCFHGVEPVNGPDQQRDIMQFNLRFVAG